MPSFSSWPTSPGMRQPVVLELPAEPVAPSTVPSDEEQGAPFVDLGLPIPESYGVDIVRALVQDPFHLMIYWEMIPESFQAIQDLFPSVPGSRFQPVLRLTDLEEGVESYIAVPLSGKYWFVTVPGHTYRVDVGGRSPDRGFVPIVRSNTVTTPRGTVSPTVDDDPQYRVETPRFVKLLDMSGFATDRVLTDVAKLDAGDPVEVETAPPEYLVNAFQHLPVAVRDVAVSVARTGKFPVDLLDELPAHIREILLGLLGEDELLSAAFLHLLPQLLRQAMHGALIDDQAHPLHLPPRFAIGSSEALQRQHEDWSWLPSMVEQYAVRSLRIEPDVLDVTASL